MLKRKNKLAKYNLTQIDIANMFGYSNPQSFYSSSAKDRILEGIEKIIEQVEQEIIRRVED